MPMPATQAEYRFSRPCALTRSPICWQIESARSPAVPDARHEVELRLVAGVGGRRGGVGSSRRSRVLRASSSLRSVTQLCHPRKLLLDREPLLNTLDSIGVTNSSQQFHKIWERPLDILQ